MRRMSKPVAVLVTAVLAAAGLVAVPIQAQAQAATYEVTVGQFLSQSVPAESMRFFPSRLKVHQGDTIRFSSESFHTATLLPTDVSAQDWIDDNASGVGDPFSLASEDPDDGGIKLNLAVLLPTRFDCGPGGAPCDFDGSSVLNSGLPFTGPLDLSVTVDAAPGESFWVICLVHTHMRMKVTVVDDAEAASAQADIDAAKSSTTAGDLEEATALHRKMLAKKTKHTDANGNVVWDAWAGVDTHNLSLYDFYPRRLTIRKGQRVRWHFGSLIYEDHTVSFPKKRALQVASGLGQPSCDPDGDSGTQPDNPPEFEDFPFCEDFAQLEFDFPTDMSNEVGNGIFGGRSDYENSGIRGALDGDFSPYTLKFRKRNLKGTPYICEIHPFMQSRVIVK